jgi:hypothetical protein
MLHYAVVQALGQARLADLHRQAQRDALARAARRARRARRQHATQRPPSGPLSPAGLAALGPRRGACDSAAPPLPDALAARLGDGR